MSFIYLTIVHTISTTVHLEMICHVFQESTNCWVCQRRRAHTM